MSTRNTGKISQLMTIRVSKNLELALTTLAKRSMKTRSEMLTELIDHYESCKHDESKKQTIESFEENTKILRAAILRVKEEAPKPAPNSNES
jgi:predicted transcriptional regulator